MISPPYCIPGVPTAAPTPVLTAGSYPTDSSCAGSRHGSAHTLEEAHYGLSNLPRARPASATAHAGEGLRPTYLLTTSTRSTSRPSGLAKSLTLPGGECAGSSDRMATWILPNGSITSRTRINRKHAGQAAATRSR